MPPKRKKKNPKNKHKNENENPKLFKTKQNSSLESETQIVQTKAINTTK